MTDGPSGHKFAEDEFIKELNTFGAKPKRVPLRQALEANPKLLDVLIAIVPDVPPSPKVEQWVVTDYPVFAAAFREMLFMVVDDPWTFSVTGHERRDNSAEVAVSLDGSNIVASFLDHDS